MLLTLNADCTEVDITSDLIVQFLADLPDAGTLKLFVTYNCADPVEIELLEEDVDTDTYTYTLLGNGVYRFKLSYIGDLTSNEYENLYSACNVECGLINHYASFKDSSAYAYHQILQRMGSCDEYTYENACDLWDELKYLIDNSDESNCGCN